MFLSILAFVGFINGTISYLVYGNIGYTLGAYLVSIIALVLAYFKFKK